MSSISELETACNGTSFSSNQFNQWFQLWNSGVCTNLYEDILYTLPNGARGYNAQELQRMQQDLTTAYNTYTQKFGFILTSNLSSANFNDWQVLLHNTCQQLPGGCAGFLTSYCSTLTRDQIAEDPTFLAFCGCYSQVNNPTGQNLVCDTLCTKQRVIKFPDNRGGFEECEEAVCVLNDINIAATQSSVGSVTINQVCNNCPTEGCRCVLNIDDLEEIDEAVGIVQVNQFCGSDSGCFQFSSTSGQPVTPVSCSSGSGSVPTPNFDNQVSLATWVGVGIAVVIAVVVVVILVIIYLTR